MGKFKRMLGISAWLGDKRKLDELLGRRDIYVTMIEHKRRDWKEAEKCLPEIDEKIAELRERIRMEEN